VRSSTVVILCLVLLAVATWYRGTQIRGSRGSTHAAHVKVEIFSDLTYPQAAEAAKGKLLLVDATASWCPPCRAMEEDTWPDSALTAWVKERGLAVQVDVDDDGKSASELGISAMPTIILFRDGRELGRTSGYMDPQELLSWLKSTAG
jgi:thiol:disulfide interchange protein